ncbi:hypothetical protein B0J11DRAFT_561675 [Dendryphion nanum]|uniref:Uncharacterized protein n=1 Tax=Dendryphion nanum TaxID=256645 RepID=A0A9P9D9S9_9PLEO|nr:hypothetical protein B0J11DRAFT_561675 [Dendryphion nanum]
MESACRGGQQNPQPRARFIYQEPENRSAIVIWISLKRSSLISHRSILKSNPKRLILAVRNLERGNTAVSELTKLEATSIKIDLRQLDQSNFLSVKAFSKGLKGQKVDSEIGDNYETDLQVHVLGPTLLSLLLLQNVRSAASARAFCSDLANPHMRFVSSGLHAMAKFPEGNLPAGEVQAALNDQTKYNRADRYQTTKLIGLLWVKESASSIEKEHIVVNAPNLGFCKTSLMRDASGIIMDIIKPSPSCVVDATIVKEDEIHGRYLSEAHIIDEAVIARGDDGQRLQKKIWNEIVGALKESDVPLTSSVPL